MDKTTNTDVISQADEKVIVTFRCSTEMQKFLADEAGEESVSTLLRTWVREKMEAKKAVEVAQAA